MSFVQSKAWKNINFDSFGMKISQVCRKLCANSESAIIFPKFRPSVVKILPGLPWKAPKNSGKPRVIAEKTSILLFFSWKTYQDCRKLCADSESAIGFENFDHLTAQKFPGTAEFWHFCAKRAKILMEKHQFCSSFGWKLTRIAGNCVLISNLHLVFRKSLI